MVELSRHLVNSGTRERHTGMDGIAPDTGG